MSIGFTVRLVRIIINIVSFAYFIGMIWLVICQGGYRLLKSPSMDEDDYFMSANGLMDMQIYD